MMLSLKTGRGTAGGLTIALVAELICMPLSASQQGDQATIENVRASTQSGQVVILYDLVGPASARYAVSVSLRREGKPEFKYLPRNLSGEFGGDLVTGRDKRIVWAIMREFPRGLPGDDYYFVVSAVSTAPRAGTPALVWIGGGVLVGGGVLYLLLAGKPKSTSDVTPPARFPDEPVRPR